MMFKSMLLLQPKDDDKHRLIASLCIELSITCNVSNLMCQYDITVCS